MRASERLYEHTVDSVVRRRCCPACVSGFCNSLTNSHQSLAAPKWRNVYDDSTGRRLSINISSTCFNLSILKFLYGDLSELYKKWSCLKPRSIVGTVLGNKSPIMVSPCLSFVSKENKMKENKDNTCTIILNINLI